MKLLKIFLLIALFINVISCHNEIVYNSKDNLIITTLAINRSNEFVVLTHEKVMKFDIFNNIEWEIIDDFDGYRMLTDSRKLYLLFSKEGSDINIKCADLETGEYDYTFYSDTISVYDILMIKENNDVYYYANGAYFDINENGIIEKLNFDKSLISNVKMKWLVKRLRTDSRLICKESLIKGITILESIMNSDSIRYISINNSYLVVEFESYFLCYDINSGSLKGKYNNSNYSYKKLNADLLYDVEENKLYDFISNQSIKYDNDINDIFQLDGEKYFVYNNKIILN